MCGSVQIELESENSIKIDIQNSSEAVKILQRFEYKYNPLDKKWTVPITNIRTIKNSLQKVPNIDVKPFPEFVLNILQFEVSKADFDLKQILQDFPKIFAALYKYQKDGIEQALRFEGRVLLADEMGLGKSIQSLGIACCYRKEWPLLVICPCSLRYNWVNEIVKWCQIDKSKIQIVAKVSETPNLEMDVCIVSYSVAKCLPEKLFCPLFKIAIVDESHYLKTFESQRFKQLSSTLRKSKRLILLSGTPALSRPIELFPQLSLIRPNIFKSLIDFGIRYCDGKRSQFGWDFSGSSMPDELKLCLKKNFAYPSTKIHHIKRFTAKNKT